MTIPELGTIRATHPPIIVLTSNRTRDLHDAVKRRCLYHWIDYPTPGARGRDRAPPRAGRVARRSPSQVADAVARMRDSDVQKPPGVAEAIDWVAALELLGVERLDAAAVDRTLGVGAEVPRGPGGGPRGRPRAARAQPVTDVRAWRRPPRPAAARRRARPAPARRRRAVDAGARRRLRPRADAGAARSPAGACTGPRGRCSSPTRRRSPAFDAVFAAVFGADRDAEPDERSDEPKPISAAAGRPHRRRGRDRRGRPRASPTRAPTSAPRRRRPATDDEADGRARRAARVASDEELPAPASASTRSSPHELAALYRLMRGWSSRRRCGARAATSGAPRRAASTCARRCARACAPAATRSASRAAGGGSCAGGS